MNKARLATGGDIFRQNDVVFSHLANAVMMTASASEENTKAGTENLLMDLSGQDADSYGKFGNKKATYRDWKNYKRSMREGGSWTKQTYVPGQLAEHMRRMEGEGTGEIGTRKYKEGLKNGEGQVVLGLSHLSNAIEGQINRIEAKMENFIPEEQMQNAPIDTKEVYCIDCLAAYLEVTPDDIQEKIEEFKEEGCVLFK